MPSGIVVGDLLIALVASDGTSEAITFTGGWTVLSVGGTTGGVTLATAYKKAVGSDTLSITIGSSEQGCCRVIRIDTAEDPDVQPPETGNLVSGASTETPPMQFNPIFPTGGTKDYKFYSLCAHDRNRPFTSAPIGYRANDATLVSGGASGAQLSWGDLDINTDSESGNPDAFTYESADGFNTMILVVHPVSAAAPFLPFYPDKTNILLRL